MALQEEGCTLFLSASLFVCPMLTQSPPYSGEKWSVTPCWRIFFFSFLFCFFGKGANSPRIQKAACVFVNAEQMVCVQVPVWYIAMIPCLTSRFPTVYLPALTQKQHNSREGFTSILKPFPAKLPLKTTFISSLGKPNIKSLEAEINPTWSYRQDFRLLSSLSLSSGRDVTEISCLRWMFLLNISPCCRF